MCIYSNENIWKIAKLTPRELPYLVQIRENNYAKIMAYTQYYKQNTLCGCLGYHHIPWLSAICNLGYICGKKEQIKPRLIRLHADDGYASDITW